MIQTRKIKRLKSYVKKTLSLKLYKLRNLLFIILLSILILSSCQQTDPKIELYKIDFNESFHDIAIIDRQQAIAYSYGSGLFIKTSDQGKNWKKVFQTDSIYLEQIIFPTSKTGYICGNTNYIYKTIDSGETWKSHRIGSIPINSMVYGMDFKTEEIGFLAVIKRSESGFSSDLYKTQNAGLSWTKTTTLSEMILNLQFIDGELWGSGNNILIKNIESENREIIFKDDQKKVGQIRSFVKVNNQLIAPSFNGYILQYANDRISIRQLTKNRLRSITLTNNYRLIVTGDSNKEIGGVFESFNYGNSWQLAINDSIDIHRIKTNKGLTMGIGKKDVLIKLIE